MKPSCLSSSLPEGDLRRKTFVSVWSKTFTKVPAQGLTSLSSCTSTRCQCSSGVNAALSAVWTRAVETSSHLLFISLSQNVNNSTVCVWSGRQVVCCNHSDVFQGVDASWSNLRCSIEEWFCVCRQECELHSQTLRLRESAHDTRGGIPPKAASGYRRSFSSVCLWFWQKCEWGTVTPLRSGYEQQVKRRLLAESVLH